MKLLAFPRARGAIGRIMNNANLSGDFSTIMAAFEGHQSEVRTQLRELGESLDEVNAALAAMRVNGSGIDGARVNLRQVFQPLRSYLRSGAMAPQAGLTEGSDPSGGYVVTPEIDNVIQNQLISISPLRGFATVVSIGQGSGPYKFPVNLRGTTSGWVGESDSRPQTNTPALAQITVAEGEVYANAGISQWLLDDANTDMAAFLQANISDEFAVQEGAAFVSGDGNLKPRGFLTYTANTSIDSARAFGTLQYVKTGAAADFAATDPGDALVNLIYSLRAPYRVGPGVAWMMNSNTAGIIRKFKDAYGRYIWTDSLLAGQPGMLLGYPVAIDENMPDIGANNFPVAFGNWRLGYRIVDRLGVRVLRDPFTAKPNVLFYSTKRVGGSAADSNAIKLLKCEA